MKHLACIMDGNRRWAKEHNLMPWLGHQEGLKALERTVDFCLEQQIPILSLYVFSLENFQRSAQELEFLFGPLFQEATKKFDTDYRQKGVRIRLVGDRSKFPASIAQLVPQLEKFDGQHTLLVNLLFAYGGQQEIISVMQQVARQVETGMLNPESITAETFHQYSWLGEIAPPDLIIRTGGAKRLSNFFLFQSAYSELYFLDCMWPEVEKSHLEQALQKFNASKRNFGK